MGGSSDQHFGISLAVNGDTLVVGALTNPDFAGTEAAYVFTRNGSTWSKQEKLLASDGAREDYFGSSVAIDDHTIVVGAPGDDTPAGQDAGSVYVYTSSPYPQVVPITINSSPDGRSFTVTGAGCQAGSYSAPRTLGWTPDASCQVAFSSPQDGPTGTQFAFATWADGGNTANPRTFTAPTAPATFTANFTTQYLLTTAVLPAGSGSITGGGYHNAGSTSAVGAAAAVGYGFTGFSGALTGTTTPQNVLMDGPKSVTGNFVVSVTITIASNIPGRSFTVTGANCHPGSYITPQSLQWVPGSSCQVAFSSPQADPSGTQYVFSTWADGGNTTNPRTFTVPAAPAIFTANFTTQSLYLLATAVNLAAAGTVSGGGTYGVGTTANISATPNTGYTFVNWTGPVASSTSASTTVLMDGPKSVTANFVGAPVTITITSSSIPGRSFTVTGANCQPGSYTTPQPLQWKAGSSCDVAFSSPHAGPTGAQYVFSTWADSESTANPRTFTVPAAPAIFTATFVISGGIRTQQAYLKASNTGVGDTFGNSVAVSGDTLVVGTLFEDSNASGINGSDNNSASDSGAAYIFVRSGGVWSQQAYLKPSNTGTNDYFGYSVAISGDTVVVGAFQEDSNAIGVNGADNNSASNSGAAYVFVRDGSVWSQQAYLKASNTGAGDQFGYSVAVSGDTVVVGAFEEDSNATGVNGDQSNNSTIGSGAAYVFVRSGSVWSQQAFLKASNSGQSDEFGHSVAVSGDTAVVGAFTEDSNSPGVNGDQANDNTGGAGAAYVFVRSGGVWSQQAYLKASNPGVFDLFGHAVAVSGDTVVVGAFNEDSNAKGINGNQSNNSANDAGAAYVFVRSAGVWTQQVYLKASNSEADDEFAHSVAISGDTVVVGAQYESSNATGINGNQSDNSVSGAGATYVFVRSAGVWSQQAYLKATNPDHDDVFSFVAVSGDTVVVGAYGESSNATGIDGNQSDNSASYAGAAYVFSTEPTQQYLLTTVVNPAGAGTVSGGGTYDAGSTPIISATPNPGFAFVDWSGPVASSTSASTTVLMNGPRTVTANFVTSGGISLSGSTSWIGLKNSDDQGTQFDLRAELYKNGNLISSGQTLCITGVTRNENQAKQVAVLFGSVSGGTLNPGDTLSVKMLTRIGTNPDGTKCPGPGGSHSNAVGLRLYYDSTNRPSRFGAAIAPNPLSDLFLHSSGTNYYFDTTAPTAASPKSKDSAGVNFAGGNLWKEIGTWSRTIP